MNTLVRTEWLKMRKYNAFWWIMGITLLSYPGMNYMAYFIYNEMTNRPDQISQYAKMAIGNPFAFPEAWHTVTFFSSLFLFVPAVVVIMLISNEYTFRTHRQNVIDGWSRSQFITSKLIDVLIISFLITLMCFGVGLATGLANQHGLIHYTWDQVYYLGLFFLQTFAQLSIAFLLGFLIKKAFLALGIFLFYFIILENMIIGVLEWKGFTAGNYFPLEVSDKLIPKPAFWSKINPEAYQQSIDAIPLHIGLTILVTAIVWFICYRSNNRRDLK